MKAVVQRRCVKCGDFDCGFSDAGLVSGLCTGCEEDEEQ